MAEVSEELDLAQRVLRVVEGAEHGRDFLDGNLLTSAALGRLPDSPLGTRGYALRLEDVPDHTERAGADHLVDGVLRGAEVLIAQHGKQAEGKRAGRRATQEVGAALKALRRRN